MKKKVIALLLSLTFLAMLSVNVFAADKYFTLSMTADKMGVKKGETFVLTMALENITVPNGVLGITVPLSFDNTKVAVTHIEPIIPSEWENGIHMIPSTDILNQKGEIKTIVLDDGFTLTGGAKKDGSVGCKFTFEVITDSDTAVKFVTTDANATCALSPDPNVESDVVAYDGEDNFVVVTLNGGKETDVPSEDTEPSSEEASLGGGSTQSEDEQSKEAPESQASSVDASEEQTSKSEASASSDDTNGEDNSGAIIIVGIICAVVVLAVAFTAIAKRKNKKDGDNPVNPA